MRGGETMGLAERKMLCEELKKNEVCNNYWAEQMEYELEKDIQLAHEPVGDMSIYSKYFEFHTRYIGDRPELLGTTAVVKIGITSNCPKYDIKKAEAGTDCFHNVRIIVSKEEKELITAKFRLWSEEEPQYCGKETALKLVLQN